MKNVQVKSILFSLLAVLMVSVFMTSCEQEAIVNQVEDLSPEMIMQDADVIAFIAAYEKGERVVGEKIQVNQAAYDRYIAEGNFDAINDLLNYDEDIQPLMDVVEEKRNIILQKYPDLTEVNGILLTNESSTEVGSRCSYFAWVYYWSRCSWACSVVVDPNQCREDCMNYWCP